MSKRQNKKARNKAKNAGVCKVKIKPLKTIVIGKKEIRELEDLIGSSSFGKRSWQKDYSEVQSEGF